MAVGRGLGIRGKLFVALGCIAAMAGIAGGGAAWSLRATGRMIDQLGRETVPSIANSLRLAQRGTALAGEAPSLAASRDAADLAARRAALAAILAEQGRRVAELRAHIDDGAALERVAAGSSAIAVDIARLGALTEQRLAIKGAIDGIVATAIAAYGDLADYARPLSEVARVQVKDRVHEIGDATDREAALKLAETLSTSDMPLMQAQMDIESNGNLLVGAITAEANLPQGDAFDDLKQRYGWAELAIGKALDAFKDPGDHAKLKTLSDALLDLGRGKDSIFAWRERQWKIDADIAAILPRTTTDATALAAEIDQLASRQQAASDAAIVLSRQVVGRSVLTQAALTLVILVSSVLIGWLYVGRRVAGRLRRLSDAMRRIATGDLATPIPLGGRDEISGMAEALTVFRDNAREVGAGHARAESERQAAAADRRRMLMALADDFETSVKEVVGRVSAAAGLVHAGAGTMAGTADHTSAEAAAALGASDTAASGVDAAAAAAGGLASSIAEISRQVNESASIARGAAADAERTDATVRSLAEAVRRIGDVTGLIDQIAGQTNLLALNATIEAARAGDAGKGFAVVASEVKSLATQTSRATQDITAQIAAMRGVATEVAGAIGAIGGTIIRINQISSAIAEAVAEQGTATQAIAGGVAAAARGTSQAVASIRDVSGAASRAGRSAGELLSAATSLTGHTQSLESEVDRFLAGVRAA